MLNTILFTNISICSINDLDSSLAVKNGEVAGTFVRMDVISYPNRLAFESSEAETPSPVPAPVNQSPHAAIQATYSVVDKTAPCNTDGVLFNDINPLYDSADAMGFKAMETPFMPPAAADPFSLYDTPATAIELARRDTQRKNAARENITANSVEAAAQLTYDSLDAVVREPISSAATAKAAPNKDVDQNFAAEPTLYDSLDGVVNETIATRSSEGVVMEEPPLYDSLDGAIDKMSEVSTPAAVQNMNTGMSDGFLEPTTLYDTLEGTGAVLQDAEGVYDSISDLKMLDRSADKFSSR